MKKLVLLLIVLSFLACKKDKVEDLTKYNWILKSAIVTPGKLYDGKLETDYIKTDPSTCLHNSFAINFEKNGTYSYSSNGPLCDLPANDGTLKWEKNGNNVSLINTRSNNITINANLESTKLTYTTTFNDSNVGTNYTIVWTFIGQPK
eukprot:GDKJ01027556.1.p1 GENE.GDKJ01027556.1~~GDKJ01027556.1.p1  ORF type:complete len:148 (+),score=7.02 GDKJ01027556.1:206-649(+)